MYVLQTSDDMAIACYVWLNMFGGTEIWLDWLKDEIRLTEDESEREKVYELFERAVNDYVCKCGLIMFI